MDTQVARERLEEMHRELSGEAKEIRARLEAGVTPDAAEGGRDVGDEGAHEQFAGQDLALLDGIDRRLVGVEAALRRIEDGTYGLSVVSGKPIPDERLEVRPDAETLVEEENPDA
ncbi:TraR/DksA family transcriptional regulator [Kineococcus gynurae]|uniref:TraR/DksA family transcriptional regulator n=1 Tax=Kineococcus gynurae TaxID=452979 RepID=A0ABV5LV73_9ACTN